MNRGVNCNSPDIANTVIEKRQQQIRTAQMLMAFGNALKGQPVMNVPAMGTLPNYSSRKTMYIKESETIAGFNKICVYSFGATKTTRTIAATGICPLSVTE